MADQADPETLVSLLKEKAKELKLVQKKLTKVEDKFVETHKLQKALVRDRETFQLFLQVVFGEHPQTISEVYLGDSSDQYGLYDIDLLKSFYVLVQTQKTQQHLVEKAQLEDRLKEFERDAVRILDLKLELESLRNQILALTQEAIQSKSALAHSQQLLKSAEARADSL